MSEEEPEPCPSSPAPLFFLQPGSREAITSEPGRKGRFFDPRYPDVSWQTFEGQGGGKVPLDFAWTSNPKQEQDERSCG